MFNSYVKLPEGSILGNYPNHQEFPRQYDVMIYHGDSDLDCETSNETDH